ncbi:unnamed protein product [Ceratitis capitata]|uniref:(Mediterranean fruit fly) hypothetical protein n=1 Tax=Ceratitis capitata TaxID=7213 RepID=A0A811V122_CERCA|nr:unnamed protein product [Ceratitis capitata]
MPQIFDPESWEQQAMTTTYRTPASITEYDEHNVFSSNQKAIKTICAEPIKFLPKAENKVRFDVRNAKIKIFQSDKSAEKYVMKQIENVNPLLMAIDQRSKQ